MSADDPVTGWEPAVIDFLSSALPRYSEGEGWQHMCSTAYQIGCEALVALGHAKETGWGAMPLANPTPPSTPPRWDDICIAVLGLAQQQHALSYLRTEGSKQPDNTGYVVIPLGSQQNTPPANIASTGELGPAYATSESISVLQALGLVAQGQWTTEAETILWREQPRAWELDYSADPRFVTAVNLAVDTLPSDIRQEIDRLVVISDEEIEEAIAQHRAATEELRQRFGPKARIGRLRTPQETRLGLEFNRRGQLDWVFFRHWRLSDCWLDTQQAELALEIFNDPLAIQMRRAVMTHLYPDSPEFLESITRRQDTPFPPPPAPGQGPHRGRACAVYP